MSIKGSRRKLAAWIWTMLAAGWIMLVFFFSSQPYKDQNIQPLLRRLLKGHDFKRYLPDISFTYGNKLIIVKQMPYTFLEFVFRKSAHLFIYAMLAAIVFILVRALNRRRIGIACAAALLATGIVAAADEWNQLQQIHRSGSLIDIGLDLIGGLLGLLAVLALLGMRAIWRSYKRKRNARIK